MVVPTMRVFVSGATGVVGRRVVPLLINAGHQVTAAGRNPDKLRRLQEQGIRAEGVDLFDPAAVRRAVAGAEAIVNLATAVPPPGPRMFLPRAWHPMDRVRCEVARNLVDAALAGGTVERIIQEAFAPIYASAGDAWVDETAPVRPARYNRSVLAAEESADRFTRAGRVGVVLRYGFFYGPADIATTALLDAVRRGWFPLLGPPEAYVSWISHDDAASAAAAALHLPAGIYNVVDDEPLRRRELADGIARQLGTGPPKFLPGWVTPLAGPVGQRSRDRSGSRIGNFETRVHGVLEAGTRSTVSQRWPPAMGIDSPAIAANRPASEPSVPQIP